MAFFKFRQSSSSGAEPSTAGAPTPLSLEALRRRARNRLIGAAVLVLLGVVGFPLLFDTQPRPVVADIQIDIPDKAKAKPLALPAPVVAAASAPVSTPVAPVTPPVVEPAPAPEPKPVPKTEARPAPKAEAKPETKAAPVKPAVAASSAEADKARALLEGRDAPAAAGQRYVVQVGAYSDAAKLRDVRQKLEAAHLKTYTQAVDTKDGQRTRVRVGPFATQAEADKAAARVKALDLPAAVLKM